MSAENKRNYKSLLTYIHFFRGNRDAMIALF